MSTTQSPTATAPVLVVDIAAEQHQRELADMRRAHTERRRNLERRQREERTAAANIANQRARRERLFDLDVRHVREREHQERRHGNALRDLQARYKARAEKARKGRTAAGDGAEVEATTHRNQFNPADRHHPDYTAMWARRRAEADAARTAQYEAQDVACAEAKDATEASKAKGRKTQAAQLTAATEAERAEERAAEAASAMAAMEKAEAALQTARAHWLASLLALGLPARPTVQGGRGCKHLRLPGRGRRGQRDFARLRARNGT